MKKIILFISLGFLCITGYSQTYTTEYCPYLYNLSGFWKGTSGSDTFRIYLKVQRNKYSFRTSDDMVYGYHEFKQGSTINQSNLANHTEVIDTISFPPPSTPANYHYSFILGSANCNPYPDTLYGYFKDLTKNQRFNLTVHVLNATTLKFRQDYTEGFEFINGSPKSGFTIPREIILYKE